MPSPDVNDERRSRMKVAFYTNIVSPHQIPLAKEVARRVGEGNFRYIYRDDLDGERVEMGWGQTDPEWCAMGCEDDPWLEGADLVYTGGLRAVDLVARRIAAGKKTLYYTERWFKPYHGLPGKWRMYCPGYRRMAKRMVKMLNDPLCRVLAVGPWAKRDMLELGVREEQIVDWGYFVEPTTEGPREPDSNSYLLKVLWVGRMMRLKRVDTIIKAVKEISKSREEPSDIALTLIGDGLDRLSLEGKVGSAPVVFKDPQPIERIRKAMRRNDVYVLASDENEGWGAVVNEALEEGMKVLGTYEAGASAALLDEEDLFHAGDWKSLAMMLARCARAKRKGELAGQGIGDWTPARAAERMLGLA